MDTRPLSPAPSMNTGDRAGKVVHTRSRRGCLTCRARHIKCDEGVPTCGSCRRLRHDCKWGLRLSFNASRETHLSEHDSSALASIESLRFIPRQYNFVNEANHVVQEESLTNSTPSNTSLGAFTSPTRHTYEETAFSGISGSEVQDRAPACYQKPRIRTLTSPDASSPSGTDIVDCSTDLSAPESLYVSRPDYTGQSYNDIFHLIRDRSVKSRLISCYFKNVSRWCELTDSRQTFTAVHGRLVVQSRCFGTAALAVSAKYLEITENLYESTELSAQLYQQARLLLPEISDSQTGPESNSASHRLASAMLSLYCAMTPQSEELRAQLYFYINALQLHAWEDPPNLTSAACFWVMARLDMWNAHQCRQPTLIHENSCFKFSSVDTGNLQDHWANRAMHIFSRIVNQLSRSHHAPGMLQELWEALQSWVVERPECMQPVLETEIKENDAFPVILFSNSSAVCGNIFYHAGCILLLNTSHLQPFPRALITISNPLCHARRVGAISISNDQDQWINNIEPISIAAQHYVKPEEQILILKHLKEIKTYTGWETAHKSRDLRILWGLD